MEISDIVQIFTCKTRSFEKFIFESILFSISGLIFKRFGDFQSGYIELLSIYFKILDISGKIKKKFQPRNMLFLKLYMLNLDICTNYRYLRILNSMKNLLFSIRFRSSRWYVVFWKMKIAIPILLLCLNSFEDCYSLSASFIFYIDHMGRSSSLR